MVEISFRTSGWIEHGLQRSLCPTTKFISLSKVPPKLLKRSPFRDLPLLMGYVLIFSSNGTYNGCLAFLVSQTLWPSG